MLLIRSSETSITDTNQAFLMSVATYLLLIEVDQFPKGKKKITNKLDIYCGRGIWQETVVASELA
jgi:hypothetical protein